MKTKHAVPFVPFLLMFATADAQTTVSGGIFSNTVWTAAGSPYVVTDDLVVFDDLVLTIEPGVVVQVHPDKRIELRNSRLVATGTEAQPILFTCTNASSTWQGLVPLGLVFNSGNQMHMEHCIVERADIGIDFDDAYHTPYEFLHCEFRDCVSGVRHGGITFNYGAYLFQDCYFHDNVNGDYGGLHTVISSRFENNGRGTGAYYLQDCSIVGNTQVGVLGAAHMTGCTLTENNIAYDGALMNNYVLEDNVAVDNVIGFRMAGFFTDEGSFSNNVICRNSLYNIQRLAWGSNQAAHIEGTCFCMEDEAAIAATIYDAVDDISVGLIDYLPLNTAPWCMNFTVGVQETARPALALSPNPTQGHALLTGNALSRLVLLDVSGRPIIERSFSPRASYELDVETLPTGLYMVRALQGEQWSTGRLIKE